MKRKEKKKKGSEEKKQVKLWKIMNNSLKWTTKQVKLWKEEGMKLPTALLAKSLLNSSNHHPRRLGVGPTNPMFTIVCLDPTKVHPATLHLAPPNWLLRGSLWSIARTRPLRRWWRWWSGGTRPHQASRINSTCTGTASHGHCFVETDLIFGKVESAWIFVWTRIHLSLFLLSFSSSFSFSRRN